MPNTNVLEGMACTGCKSDGPFLITATSIFLVEDDGTEYNGDVEWDDDSPCECRQCGKAGKVKDFKAPECADCHGVNEETQDGAGHCPTCGRGAPEDSSEYVPGDYDPPVEEPVDAQEAGRRRSVAQAMRRIGDRIEREGADFLSPSAAMAVGAVLMFAGDPPIITHQECGCPILGGHRASCKAGQ